MAALTGEALVSGLKQTLAVKSVDTPLFDQLLNGIVATPNTAVPALCFDVVRRDGLPVVLDALKLKTDTPAASKLHTSLLFVLRVLVRDDRLFPALLCEDPALVPALITALANSADPLALHTNCEVLAFLVPAAPAKALVSAVQHHAVQVLARALVASTHTQGIDNPELLHHTQIVTVRALMVIAQSDKPKAGGLAPFLAAKALPIATLAEYAVRVRAATHDLLSPAASELFHVVLALLKIVFSLVRTAEHAQAVAAALARVPAFTTTLKAVVEADAKTVAPSVVNLVAYLYSQASVFANKSVIAFTESGIPPALSPALIWQIACSACAKPATVESLPSFKRCGKCKLTSYCDAKCQLQHWTNGGHQTVCFALESKLSAVRPTPKPATATATATAAADKKAANTKPAAAPAAPATATAPAAAPAASTDAKSAAPAPAAKSGGRLKEVAPPKGMTVADIQRIAAAQAAAADAAGKPELAPPPVEAMGKLNIS